MGNIVAWQFKNCYAVVNLILPSPSPRHDDDTKHNGIKYLSDCEPS